MNATVSVTDGRCEIWAGTQQPSRGAQLVAQALGISPDAVTLHMARMGGSFGRRLQNDFLIEAAVIAKQVGGPVQLRWTREDDMRHDYYRNAGYHFLEGGVDASGRLSAWRNHFVGPTGGGMSAGQFPAGFVPNFAIYMSEITAGVPTGAMRAPGDNGIAFAMQSFIDELAHAAGKDPLQFRIDLLAQPLVQEAPAPAGRSGRGGFSRTLDAARARGVLERIRVTSGWGKRTLPKGTGVGVAFHWCHAGYFAEAAEVSVDASKRVTVNHVWAVGDIGRQIVNPLIAEGQVQSAIIEGLSQVMSLGDHDRQGRRRAGQFRRAQSGAHAQRAQGDRYRFRAERQRPDRSRGAAAAADPAGRRERHLRGHRRPRAHAAVRQVGLFVGVGHRRQRDDIGSGGGQTVRTVLAAVLLLAATIGIRAAQAPAPKTTRDKVYSKEQADRGGKLYVSLCESCHEPGKLLPGQKAGPLVVGEKFLNKWKDKTLGELLTLVETTMPNDGTAFLDDDQTADIVAYMLQANGFPAGDAPLTYGGDSAKIVIVK